MRIDVSLHVVPPPSSPPSSLLLNVDVVGSVPMCMPEIGGCGFESGSMFKTWSLSAKTDVLLHTWAWGNRKWLGAHSLCCVWFSRMFTRDAHVTLCCSDVWNSAAVSSSVCLDGAPCRKKLNTSAENRMTHSTSAIWTCSQTNEDVMFVLMFPNRTLGTFPAVLVTKQIFKSRC